MGVDRATHIHMARVFLAQARHVRPYPQHSGWRATLLLWAANRRRAAQSKQEPEQGELF
jgi:hypothetical protein